MLKISFIVLHIYCPKISADALLPVNRKYVACYISWLEIVTSSLNEHLEEQKMLQSVYLKALKCKVSSRDRPY